MKGNGTEAAEVAKQENTELGLTEARRIREHRLEYRLEVAGEKLEMLTASTLEVAVCCYSTSESSRACAFLGLE